MPVTFSQSASKRRGVPPITMQNKSINPLVALFLLLLSLAGDLRSAAPSDAGPVKPNDISSAADVERLVQSTFGPRQPPVDLPAIQRAWSTIVADATRAPIPIILDTDIGTDIDDAITLMFALSRPEF